jgi:hypothetical protein
MGFDPGILIFRHVSVLSLEKSVSVWFSPRFHPDRDWCVTHVHPICHVNHISVVLTAKKWRRLQWIESQQQALQSEAGSLRPVEQSRLMQRSREVEVADQVSIRRRRMQWRSWCHIGGAEWRHHLLVLPCRLQVLHNRVHMVQEFGRKLD